MLTCSKSDNGSSTVSLSDLQLQHMCESFFFIQNAWLKKNEPKEESATSQSNFNS